MTHHLPSFLSKYLKYRAMSHSQNEEQKTKLDVPPDETTDTGLSETLAKNDVERREQTLEISKPEELSETCSRTMTEKGFEFRSAAKEKSARTANKVFHANVSAFHGFLASSNDHDEIAKRTKSLAAIAEKTELELNAWFDAVKETPQAEIVTDLVSTIKDSIESCQRAALHKIQSIDKDEITSVRSSSSRKSSSSSSASCRSSKSSKETLIDVKAKRAALEQKIKFSDMIDEQQRVLNKLKLQQELSETLAEEAVYDKALKLEEHPFERDEIELPKETPEQMIDRFMNNTEVAPTHLTAANNLLSPVINTISVDTNTPFPALYSSTGIIHPVNYHAGTMQQPAANMADLLHKTDTENHSVLDFGTEHQANFYHETYYPANPHDNEEYSTSCQPPAVSVNGESPSTCHAPIQHITHSQTIVSRSLAGASTPLTSLPLRAANTSVTFHHPAYPISSL